MATNRDAEAGGASLSTRESRVLVVTKTLKRTASGMAWFVRGASMVIGLAVVLALVVGVSSTALGGTGVGARFDLGKTNTVNAVSRLVGSIAGPTLQLDNNSTDTAATALDLQVEPGRAPMKVNSSARVANLNADKLDDREASSFASGVNGKATDADKLDGLDSSALLPGGNLPRGRTVRGHWILGWTADASDEFQAQAMSFGYTLDSAPTVHFVAKSTQSPPECPGSVTLPQAAPGHFCVYERAFSGDTGIAGLAVCSFSCPNADRSGAMVRGFSTRTGLVFTDGTWAVTAR